jgi:N-formylglutamate amidohydrolase
VPHGGREYPAELAAELAVSPDSLRSDWLTRELYGFLPGLGITTVSTPLSRFVADVNRDPAGEQHGNFWTSVVAARTSDGRPVYRRPLSPGEIRRRIGHAHEPFHQALDQAVAGLTAQFGRVLLLDLHSFMLRTPSDVILGDRYGATARPATAALVREAFSGQGFRVGMNERFAGGWTVRRFAGVDRVDAIQVELHLRCYLERADFAEGVPRPGRPFAPAQERLRAVLAAVVSGFSGRTAAADAPDRRGVPRRSDLTAADRQNDQ